MNAEQYRALVTTLENIQQGNLPSKFNVVHAGSGRAMLETHWVNEGEIGRKIGGIFGKTGADIGDKIGDFFGGPDEKLPLDHKNPVGARPLDKTSMDVDPAAEPAVKQSSYTPATPSHDANFGPEWKDSGGGIKARRDPATGEWEFRDQYGNTAKDYKTMPNLDPVVGALGLPDARPSALQVQLIKARDAQFYPTQSWDCYGASIALCQIDHSEGMGHSNGAYIDYSNVTTDSSGMKEIFSAMGWKLIGSQPETASTGLGNVLTNTWTLKSKSGLVVVSEFMGNVAFQKGADKGLVLYVGMFVGMEDVYDKYGDRALSALAASLKLGKGCVPIQA